MLLITNWEVWDRINLGYVFHFESLLLPCSMQINWFGGWLTRALIISWCGLVSLV